MLSKDEWQGPTKRVETRDSPRYILFLYRKCIFRFSNEFGLRRDTDNRNRGGLHM